MKAIILAGGFGSRIGEETDVRPKPMIEIGGKPLLWHIMKIYSAHGINDFIICLGYRGYIIKEYFANYFLHVSDVTIDMQGKSVAYHNNCVEPWRITLFDTGLDTMTGGRLKRVRPLVGEESFLMTYGDGVADLNIRETIRFHKKHGKLCTVTAIRPPGRFGALEIGEDSKAVQFLEKPISCENWINGGFFVLEPEVCDYIENDTSVWEQEPLGTLARKHELMVYKHEGFWQHMDTLRDKKLLEQLWKSDNPPWKIWKE